MGVLYLRGSAGNIINEKVTLRFIVMGLLLQALPLFSCNHGEEDSKNCVNFQHLNRESLSVGRFILIVIRLTYS